MTTRKGRAKVIVACVNCSRAHVSCDQERPCRRCTVRGTTKTCVDAPRKKTKKTRYSPDAVQDLTLTETPRSPMGEVLPQMCSGRANSIDKGKFGSPIAVTPYPSSASNVYSILLGPRAREITAHKVDLFQNHYPLVPVSRPQDSSLAFKRLFPVDPTAERAEREDHARHIYYLNNDSMTFPEAELRWGYEISEQAAQQGPSSVCYSLETSQPRDGTAAARACARADWPHALRYATALDVYTQVRQPFPHTPGFGHLLAYLKRRLARDQVLEVCRCMAEFRPIFIACSVTLTEEDMVFMEQVFQRTLLEYVKFVALVGTPTCIWRRNGQVSYVNEEFEILSGWTRAELLNKMTFIVEILDDQSCLEYFRTFSRVAYRDFTGSEQMRVCNLLTPIDGVTVSCCCAWTLKRDVSGLPLMVIGSFMPR